MLKTLLQLGATAGALGHFFRLSLSDFYISVVLFYFFMVLDSSWAVLKWLIG